jgi:hypothetical protein
MLPLFSGELAPRGFQGPKGRRIIAQPNGLGFEKVSPPKSPERARHMIDSTWVKSLRTMFYISVTTVVLLFSSCTQDVSESNEEIKINGASAISYQRSLNRIKQSVGTHDAEELDSELLLMSLRYLATFGIEPDLPRLLDGMTYRDILVKCREIESEQDSRVAVRPDLEVSSWDWRIEHGYAIADGEVTNVSATRLESVTVLVTFRDSEGSVIKTARALIEYTPILPGQTSPFSAMTTSNPAMEKASLAFKEYAGRMLRWEKSDAQEN